MKILFISTTYPYPKDDGKKIIISSILEYLEENTAKEIDFLLIGSNEKDLAKRKTNLNLRVLDKPNILKQILNLFLYTFILRKKSIQESILYNRSILKEINELRREKYDLIIYDTIRTTQYVEKGNSNEIVYLDDLFSIRYKKMLETLKKFKNVELNPLGNFQRYLPTFMQHLIKNRTITRLLLELEQKLVKKSEINTINKMKRNLLISQDEVDYIKQKNNLFNIESIKPVLNKQDFNRTINRSNTFIFLGNLAIAHNRVSLNNFLHNNIVEMLRNNIVIKIIGKNAPEELIDLSNKYQENIILTGYVEDLANEFSTAVAMVVPLLFGTGVKLKTLEALSHGLPVISTDYGVEGINIDKSVFILENNINDFWKHMLNLKDMNTNYLYSRKSYEFFLNNYSREIVYKEYKNTF